MTRVYFACGHSTDVGDTVHVNPRCGTCGERRVSRVVPARQPRFVGTVTGPCAEYKGLEPGVVNVAPAGPLTVKES